MKGKRLGGPVAALILLAACQSNETATTAGTEITAAGEAGSQLVEESGSETSAAAANGPVNQAAAITFLSGVENGVTRGDKYNYFSLEGLAEGQNQVTAIIEGTAVDFRVTDNDWKFDYPYPGPSVTTEVTFTTDPSVSYGDTGIRLDQLNPGSYVTVTFVPNEDPEVIPPAVSVNEGEPHNFISETEGIDELITVTKMEVVEADPALHPLDNQFLKVEIQYVNNGDVTTYIAPNYFTAQDGEGKYLPLRYTYFWLNQVEPGKSFTETIYYDITSEGPYSVQFFDGAWLDVEGAAGTNGI